MKLFISYSRADKAWTLKLWRALREETAHEVWIDQRIAPAAEWWRSICEAIRACDCFVYIMTKKSIESIYCSAEMHYALALNKPVLPIMLKRCRLPDVLSHTHYQKVTYKSSMEHVLVKMLQGLHYVDIALARDEYPQRNVPAPSEPKPLFHVTETMKKIEVSLQNYDYSLAEKLLQQVIDGHEGILGDIAQDRIQKVRREREYQNVKDIIDSPELFKEAWQKFREKYPNYDPVNLSSRFIGTLSKLPDTSVGDILSPPFEWCEIPKGEVRLEKGGYVSDGGAIFLVQPFAIAKYPITNMQFQIFVDAVDGYKETFWWDYSVDAQAWRKHNQLKKTAFPETDHPRTNISWFDAIAFCRWLSLKTKTTISLPTDYQWQYAAQGKETRTYPWGNVFDKSYCNTIENRIPQTTSVTRYEGKGDSPFGVVDMSGNVWEWCVTDYETGNHDVEFLSNRRVLRGGSWYDYEFDVRLTARLGVNPSRWDFNRGFRIVQVISPTSL